LKFKWNSCLLLVCTLSFIIKIIFLIVRLLSVVGSLKYNFEEALRRDDVKAIVITGDCNLIYIYIYIKDIYELI